MCEMPQELMLLLVWKVMIMSQSDYILTDKCLAFTGIEVEPTYFCDHHFVYIMIVSANADLKSEMSAECAMHL